MNITSFLASKIMPFSTYNFFWKILERVLKKYIYIYRRNCLPKSLQITSLTEIKFKLLKRIYVTSFGSWLSDSFPTSHPLKNCCPNLLVYLLFYIVNAIFWRENVIYLFIRLTVCIKVQHQLNQTSLVNFISYFITTYTKTVLKVQCKSFLETQLEMIIYDLHTSIVLHKFTHVIILTFLSINTFFMLENLRVLTHISNQQIIFILGILFITQCSVS